MIYRSFLALALTVLALTPASANTAQSDAAHGYWLTQNGKAIIHLTDCGGTTCGKMVWVATPRDDAGQLKLDVNNVDTVKRNRAICGLQLIGGMQPNSAGNWRDGWIYNPRDGETYSADLKAVSTTQLKVRGFLGVRLLGKSQTWTRVNDDRGGC